MTLLSSNVCDEDELQLKHTWQQTCVVYIAHRYHLGSVALGSFVVALIQFVRFLLEYLEKKSKIAQAKAGVAGAFVKYLMCCVNCCMWYLEKVVKFINRCSLWHAHIKLIHTMHNYIPMGVHAPSAGILPVQNTSSASNLAGCSL